MTLFKHFKVVSPLYKYVKHPVKEIEELKYMAAHAIFSLAGLMLGTLLIFGRYLTFIAICFYLTFPIWYASTYYHEYFSNRYTGNMDKKISDNIKRRLESESLRSEVNAVGEKVEGGNLKERIMRSTKD